MTTTVKYCLRCAALISLLRPSTEDEIRFLGAAQHHYLPIKPEGPCDKCGQTKRLTYYQLPG